MTESKSNKMSRKTSLDDSCVIDVPDWGSRIVGFDLSNTGSAVRWLGAVALVDEMLKKHVHPFCNLSAVALNILSECRSSVTGALLLPCEDPYSNVVGMLFLLGFFAESAATYQMIVPDDLNANRLAMVLTILDKTSSSPGDLLSSMRLTSFMEA